MFLRLKFATLMTLIVSLLVISACGQNEEKVTATSIPEATKVGTSVGTPNPTAAVSQSPTAVPVLSSGGLVKTGTILDTAITAPYYELDNVRYGGTFKEALSYSSGNLDPKFNNQNISTDSAYVYETLTTWAPNQGDRLYHLEGNLADSWKISDDLTTYTFTLHKGIKWQNIAPVSGREFVADDVVFSLNRYREKDSYWVASYDQIASITAPDKYTVVIKVKEPTAWAINDLFPNIQWVVAPELVKESGGDLGTKMVGTGPYLLKEYGFRRGGTYVRNPDYWKKDLKGNVLPYTDAIETVFITDNATAVAGYRTSQIDRAGNLATEDILNLAKSIPGLRIYSSTTPTRFGISFNTRVKPWSDVNVRRAFNMALDKEKFINQVITVQGNWEWAGPLPWSLISDKPLTSADLGPYYQYNPEESKKLRVQAGFSDGKIKVSTPILFGTPGYHVPRMPVLQALWKKEGIDIEIQAADRAVFQDAYYKREQKDLSLTFQNTGDYTLNWYAQNKFRFTNFQNTSWINDPEVEKVAAAVKVTTDPAKLKEYAKFLWDFETLGSWVIWAPAEPTYIANSPHVRSDTSRQGFTNHAPMRWLSDAPRTTP